MSWKSISFDWNQVRAFLATAEAGSLSAGARTLGLTQPTLSRQVAALEKDLGVLLFERVGRSLALTQPGRELLEHVRAMGEAAGRISMVAEGQSQGAEGLVRISTNDAVAAYLMPSLLKKIHELAPRIDVDIVSSNEISNLMRREADIAVRHIEPDQPELIARRCAGTTAHLYAATSYLEKHGRPKSVRELTEAEFIGFEEPEGLLAELNARGIPVTQRNFRWTTNSFSVCWEMVKAGLGVSIMFKEIAEVTPGVEMVLPELGRIPVPVWLVSHRELHTSRRIRVVFDVLADAFGAE